tara:strand:- start:354 stop:764 length:411 start_codon:yes stop_codon:yes gene_type:complete
MAALNETRNATVLASIASQGLVLKSGGSGKVTVTAAKGDTAIGVAAAESSRDAAGALEGDGVGTVAVYPLSGIVYLKYGATADLNFGDPVYVLDSGAGKVTGDIQTNAKLLGYYFGASGTDLADGDLIPVACGRWA